LGAFQVTCSETYAYVGGSVAGRSIDGNVGIFLINILAVNKSDGAVASGSLVGELCGNPSRPLQPGEMLNIQAKAQFRKYDTGWQFEALR
jgi:hypothetical protein